MSDSRPLTIIHMARAAETRANAAPYARLICGTDHMSRLPAASQAHGASNGTRSTATLEVAAGTMALAVKRPISFTTLSTTCTAVAAAIFDLNQEPVSALHVLALI